MYEYKLFDTYVFYIIYFIIYIFLIFNFIMRLLDNLLLYKIIV